MSDKSLVCINSCNRFAFFKLLLPDYLTFCFNNAEFDFLIALDGKSEDYLKFSENEKLPLLFSEERNGVGISKNRVLERFPDYSYYFFLDDDVELLNPNIFINHIKAAKQTGFSHFSGGHMPYFNQMAEIKQYGKFSVLHSNNGSGAFNFFTKQGLEIVGGWHDEFAKYKRYGHTEHSIRFVNAGLQPYPFNVLTKYMEGYIRIHELPHVTDYSKMDVGESGLGKPEEAIIQQKLTHYPIHTLGKYKFNEKSTTIGSLSKNIAQSASKRLFDRIFSMDFLTKEEKIIVSKDLYAIALAENQLLEKELTKSQSVINSITQSNSFKILNRINKAIKRKH